ncbi:fad-dependent pyridine nucleotide-disulfide oxidoreductase [Ophiostoma piceae UAMH 11346]|uniref:Fad-dependent pyridine nucleotide-disulfide oxidoreductase n=1 Tax=Ophiostoma piceae (strain UAMH 11346) TaxID=1262450 RepID=S3D3K9_OPHP1|nr:fad-dependent pyridine nucleotide-disulfide oxidoreductase [Ophiostoma piceae UAMH 11346]
MTITQYYILPTALIPNSPRPLLHYTNVLPAIAKGEDGFDRVDPVAGYTLFKKNGWQVAWIYRYGATQRSHFHPEVHECMIVLSGRATIRFGAGDISDDLHQNTHGDAWEKGTLVTPVTPDDPRGSAVIPGGTPGVYVVPSGGVTLEAKAGDVFVIPAGVAHKTLNTRPAAAFQLMSPGVGLSFGDSESKMPSTLASISLSGFTMMGAYISTEWDSAIRGGDFEASWMVPRPASDPVFGTGPEGLCGTWFGIPGSERVSMLRS